MKLSDRNQLLETAYLATDYVVEGASRIVIRIGKSCQALDQLLERDGIGSWAFVTASNPGSEILADTENAKRMQHLERDIASAGFRTLLGKGTAADCSWPTEKSFLILGIDVEEARLLAQRYGQLAFVFGEGGGKARLVWVEGCASDC